MFGRLLLTVALLFSIASLAQAQEHPDLSGTWKLKLESSDYGDLQGPDTRIDVIEQHDSHVSDRMSVEGRRRKQRYTLLFATDGKETELPPGTKTGITTILKVSGRWQGDALVVTQKLQSQGNNLVLTNTYTLSRDGKMLKITVARASDSRVLAVFAFDRVLKG